jgi:hypothetical protein
MIKLQACIAWLLVVSAAIHADEPATTLTTLREADLFYNEHCLRCHNEAKSAGGFRIDELLARPTIEGVEDPWMNVLEKLVSREMPPTDEVKRPSTADFEKQIAWLRGELETSERLTAAARPRAQRRLNRAEYNRTVSDLFGLPLRPADGFPPDDKLHGFDTVAEGLNTSVVLLERYLDAAKSVAARVPRPFPEQVPKATTFTTRANRIDGKDDPNFRLFDPNSFLNFGGTNDGAWDRRHWVGHAWGTELRVEHSGNYKVKMYGRPRHFAKGERAIIRMEIDERVVGLFDSPAEEEGSDMLFETSVWIDQNSGSLPFLFTFVNGNPFGGAVGETVDYYPSCWQRHHDAKQKHFQEHIGKTGDSWMPYELDGLDIRWIEDVQLEISGPHFDAWPPNGLQREFATELKARDLRGVVAGLLPKAYRRSVTNAEIERIVTFAETSTEKNSSFEDKLQSALIRILMAPEFLFLVEAVPPSTPRGSYRLTNWELASRLSYFLTGTMPDSELRAAAERGELIDPAKLDAQVQRLLLDPRCSAALTEGFLNSWLQLDRLAGVMPEPKLFPHFGDDLKRSMAEEPKAFFAALLRENGKITDLIDANYTWANERLAMHYGLDRETIRGSSLRRVDLPNRQRGGLLGMAGLLTLTSEATRTSPVKRGIFVLENIFNRPPPPPPPDVGELIPNTASAKSISEHIALHRESSACAGCHNRIDPWGLALENFDAVGAWRISEPAWEDPSLPQKRKEGDHLPTFPIDSDLELPIMSDGAKQATGLDAVRAELHHRQEDFARGFTEKMMAYGLGRGLVISDHKQIEEVITAFKKDDYRLQALLRAVVLSPTFQTR